ncbi:hypothetical protein O7621_02160 [Solwaraspora sp. WMMD937]|uniref:hypothetical protein n=1 Tax=Solwaraspora sp. WMMD937 TaxID=3016090 RepID=UPI00249AA839|nr:hypothetical protein [Solwaraspora sp. WMMD937]WFE22197.1 hypothetical protein O7621_02160 [Solwaraspora sp. WMMD937]
MPQEFDARFGAKYSELVTAVWSSDEELQKLLEDPTAYARRAGLPVEQGATVIVDRAQPSTMYTKDEIMADWNSAPGRHVLHVPETPLIDPSELTESELDAVAAGRAPEDDNNINIVAVIFI